MHQFLFAVIFTVFVYSPFTYAIDRINLSIGSLSRPSYDVATISSFRLGLSWDANYLKFDTSTQSSIRLESSLGLNQTSLGDVIDISAAPVFHYQFNSFNQKVFFEISAGAAYLSKTNWAAYHELGPHLQFADRLGVGYTFEKSEISLNFFHFSNAGTNNHNPGADMLLLRTSFQL